ncbi:MAG: hypothetical protein ACYSTL_06240 [Planctomycetota bacterium]|jgi:hypothetical protein
MSDETPKVSSWTERGRLRTFGSAVVDQARKTGGVLALRGGEIHLPRVFGFCRGVERALEILGAAVNARLPTGRKLFLLGEIIHNPWVNEYFETCGSFHRNNATNRRSLSHRKIVR